MRELSASTSSQTDRATSEKGNGPALALAAITGLAGSVSAWSAVPAQWAEPLWQPGSVMVSTGITAGIAAAAGLLAAWAGNALDSWPRRIALLAAGSGLALLQSWLLGQRGLTWEPCSFILAATAGMIAGALAAPEPLSAARWFTGRLNRHALVRLKSVPADSFLLPDQRDTAIITVRLLNDARLREQLPARDFLRLCDNFRNRASQILLEHGALIDSPDPGSVRGYFGLPLAVENHATAACGAALALSDQLRAFAVEQMRRESDPPEFGTGITSGSLAAGLTDGHYTAAGDALEQSRWLAGLNADYQTQILTDDNTQLLAGESMLSRPLEVMNPPEGAAVCVHQLLASSGGLSIEAMKRRAAFLNGILLLRAGHAGDAHNCFAEARVGLIGPDAVLDRFSAQAAEMAARDAAKAPAPASEIPLVSLPPRTKPRRQKQPRR